MEAENCGAGIEPLDEDDEEEDVLPFELPLPKEGAGPTGTELFGTGTAKGLFGFCVIFGA